MGNHLPWPADQNPSRRRHVPPSQTPEGGPRRPSPDALGLVGTRMYSGISEWPFGFACGHARCREGNNSWLNKPVNHASTLPCVNASCEGSVPFSRGYAARHSHTPHVVNSQPNGHEPILNAQGARMGHRGVACPKCGRLEAIQRVSAIVAEQAFEISASGIGSSTYVDAVGTQVSILARQLSPPIEPRRPAGLGLWWVAIFGISGWLTLVPSPSDLYGLENAPMSKWKSISINWTGH